MHWSRDIKTSILKKAFDSGKRYRCCGQSTFSSRFDDKNNTNIFISRNNLYFAISVQKKKNEALVLHKYYSYVIKLCKIILFIRNPTLDFLCNYILSENKHAK